MPNLILMFKHKVLAVYPLSPDTTTTIGRHGSNDIAIDNQVVSGLHAHAEYRRQTITLTDLQSKNGTYVNGEVISQTVLRHNDVITIGKHTIKVDTSTGKDGDNPDEMPDAD